MTRAKQNSTQHGQSAARLSVTIETPKESRNKLKFDQGTRQFKLSKVMPEGMMFPYDFGFVPSTKAEDGDPLDVLVLTDEPLFSGLSGRMLANWSPQSRTTLSPRQRSPVWLGSVSCSRSSNRT